MRRILLISQGFPKYVGDSTAPFMEAIVRQLAARGNLVDVVLPHHPEFRYPPGPGFEFFPYRYSPSERLSPWGFGSSLNGTSRVRAETALVIPTVALSLRRRVRSLLGERSYDVVHANWLVPNAWAAAHAAQQHGVPLVITLHGSDVAIAERNVLVRHLARRAISAAGAITAVSADLQGRIEKLGADSTITQIVHLGVDTDQFAPRELDPTVRERLRASPDAFLIVAVGRLLEVKGFRYLIDAASTVPDAHLAVVGDGALRGELETSARMSGASVTFTGNLDRPAVSEALAAADVVAVPSVTGPAGNVDGLPTTLLEALSSGRAVVASAVGGIPEVVSHRANGLLVPEKDVGALAEALAELRDDRELRDRLGQEARRRALAELDWDATAAAFEEAYAAAGASSSP
jgi:glycosyltransferase involved in cell wall biosynthesis